VNFHKFGKGKVARWDSESYGQQESDQNVGHHYGVDGWVGVLNQVLVITCLMFSTKSQCRLGMVLVVVVVMVDVLTVLEGMVILVGVMPWITSLFLSFFSSSVYMKLHFSLSVYLSVTVLCLHPP
jgi:hypothetical protein